MMLKNVFIALLLTMSAKAAVTIEKIDFKGWPNSYRMTNGEVELVITGDIGPRIMRYGFIGGRNFFHEFAGQMGRSGESTWQNRGGHRDLAGLTQSRHYFDRRRARKKSRTHWSRFE